VSYTFGTSVKAALRLEGIAEFFNPLAADLIRQYVSNQTNIAVDLGCGPGFTTNMLATSTKAKNTIGLDNSAEMLSFAMSRFPKFQFVEHDVTKVPFPNAADVMYCRFLLSHLVEPVSLINKWITQLSQNGIIVIEELDSIDTENTLFNTYLSINSKLVQSQGASLYVGELLSKGRYDADVLFNDCNRLPVRDSQAASWFYPNTITIWRDDNVISDFLTSDEIDSISDSLYEIMNSDSNTSTITWYMRRIVLCHAAR